MLVKAKVNEEKSLRLPNFVKRDIIKIVFQTIGMGEYTMQLLTFSLNGMDYGIPIQDVESIENRMSVVTVPTSPSHIRGIIRLHGEIVPVFSLASRFGLGNLPVENLVVSNVGGMKIALEVEKVKEIVNVENKRVLPMPTIMNAEANCFNDVASCQKELIVMLDVKGLVSLEEQQAIRKMISDGAGDGNA